MRDSAVIVVMVVGLLLFDGCERVFINSAKNAQEQRHDLANCTARAERLPLRNPNPKLPPGAERKAQVLAFVDDCMIAKGYQSQMVRTW